RVVSAAAVGVGLEALDDGRSYREASALSGVSSSTLRRRAREVGLIRRLVARPGRPRACAAAVAVAVDAVAAGATPARAAALVGLSASTVRRRVAEQGVVVAERKHREGALTPRQREEIRVGIDRGETDTAIAGRVGCHRGTIGREIARNGGRGAYRAHAAQEQAEQRARRPKPGWTETRPWLWAEVQAHIRTKKWSPEQITGRLRDEHPGDPRWWVSHEAICQAVFVQAKPELRKELAACLRTGRARRHPRGRTSPGANPKIVG